MDEYNILDWDNTPDMSKQFSFNQLNEIMDNAHWVLQILGNNATSQPQVSFMNGNVLYLDIEFFLATDNTLKSILSCCKLSNFSDAFLLTRKYRDDLFQYLFMVFAMNKIETFKYQNGYIKLMKYLKLQLIILNMKKH